MSITFNRAFCLHITAGCEITVGHRACSSNLAQRPVEKRFLLLNVQKMSIENLFVVKPQRLNRNSHENSIRLIIFYKVIIQHR